MEHKNFTRVLAAFAVTSSLFFASGSEGGAGVAYAEDRQVFLIGDFNDWNVPNDTQLNGAIEMPFENEDVAPGVLGSGEDYTISHYFAVGDHSFAFFTKYYSSDSNKCTDRYIGGPEQPFMLFRNSDQSNLPTLEEGAMQLEDDLTSINKFQLTNWKGGEVELHILFNVLGYRIFSNDAPLASQEEINRASGVEDVEIAEGNPEYFSLQGAKIVNPESGIYIKKINGKATKVVIP